jgi:hypothetical protein
VEGADEEGGVSGWRCADGLRRSVVRGIIWLLCIVGWKRAVLGPSIRLLERVNRRPALGSNG